MTSFCLDEIMSLAEQALGPVQLTTPRGGGAGGNLKHQHQEGKQASSVTAAPGG